ncbi:nucleotidyltransferase substrate binding protein [Aquiflexum lacus]|uniref:nucleotidyltransferase substrate binding protein n=1 Tax=Aquiflexum lacus TaxID=2483805 RepID=UPI001893F7DA|nr:nucleotidyltransferase substrate binding protein [Aquiflexum lacus]
MMENTRWEQRFENYLKALIQSENAVKLAEERELTDLEKQGLIQAFEFTHELAWNVIKDYFFFQGNSEIIGSRDASREAFKVGLVQDGEGWMEMIKSRNKTSHTYNEDIASEITEKIIERYFELFKEFEEKMLEIKDKRK